MLFLFLDCETTGLVKSDKIMEIGAILVDLDQETWQMKKISEFETLVRIDEKIDEKISRITGIDNEMLKNSPKLENAQKLWQNWLQKEIQNWQNNQQNDLNDPNMAKNSSNSKENNKIENTNLEAKMDLKTKKLNKEIEVNFNPDSENENLKNKKKDCQIVIIGHSLSFDLGFLRRENWFLPENFATIDTLDLSKIFLPFLSAVNLEFLTKKLNLKTKSRNFENGFKDNFSDNFGNNSDEVLVDNLEIPKKNEELDLQNESGKKLENNEKNLEFEELDEELDLSNNFHRAKFDAECSFWLLEYLLDFFVFCYNLDSESNVQNESEKEYWTDQFLENLGEFLPLNLLNIQEIIKKRNQQQTLNLEKNKPEIGETQTLENKLQKPVILKNKEETEQTWEKVINLEGFETLSFSDKLANWSQIESKRLQNILHQKLPKNLNLLVLQLFFIAFVHQNWSKLEAKLYDKLENSQNRNTNSKPNLKPNLKLHSQKDLFLIGELFLENC